MPLLDSLYDNLKAVCVVCKGKTNQKICLKCGHLVSHVTVEDENLLTTFNRLRKFMMLSTGIKAVDEKVRAELGDWLTPSEEYVAIIREGKRPRLSPERKAELMALLEVRIKKGIVDTDTRFEPFYNLSIRKIPFEKENGEIGYTKLKQLFIYSNPIVDSGQYRITKRSESYICTDDKTGKHLNKFDSESLDKFLSYLFDATTVNFILMEML